MGDLNPSPRKNSRFFEILFAVDGAELQLVLKMIRKINPERHFNIVDVTDFFVLEIIHQCHRINRRRRYQNNSGCKSGLFYLWSTADIQYDR